MNDAAVDQFHESAHHPGAVEETAQQGFILAQRLVPAVDLPPLAEVVAGAGMLCPRKLDAVRYQAELTACLV